MYEFNEKPMDIAFVNRVWNHFNAKGNKIIFMSDTYKILKDDKVVEIPFIEGHNYITVNKTNITPKDVSQGHYFKLYKSTLKNTNKHRNHNKLMSGDNYSEFVTKNYKYYAIIKPEWINNHVDISCHTYTITNCVNITKINKISSSYDIMGELLKCNEEFIKLALDEPDKHLIKLIKEFPKSILHMGTRLNKNIIRNVVHKIDDNVISQINNNDLYESFAKYNPINVKKRCHAHRYVYDSEEGIIDPKKLFDDYYVKLAQMYIPALGFYSLSSEDINNYEKFFVAESLRLCKFIKEKYENIPLEEYTLHNTFLDQIPYLCCNRDTNMHSTSHDNLLDMIDESTKNIWLVAPTNMYCDTGNYKKKQIKQFIKNNKDLVPYINESVLICYGISELNQMFKMFDKSEWKNLNTIKNNVIKKLKCDEQFNKSRIFDFYYNYNENCVDNGFAKYNYTYITKNKEFNETLESIKKITFDEVTGSLRSIKEKNRTTKICRDYVKKSYKNLSYVPEQTLELIAIAIKTSSIWNLNDLVKRLNIPIEKYKYFCVADYGKRYSKLFEGDNAKFYDLDVLKYEINRCPSMTIHIAKKYLKIIDIEKYFKKTLDKDIQYFWTVDILNIDDDAVFTIPNMDKIVSNDKVYDEIVEIAARTRGCYIGFIKVQTEELIRCVLDQNVCNVVFIRNMTDEYKFNLIKTRRGITRYLNHDRLLKKFVKTEKDWIKLVKANPELILFCDKPSYEICIAAVKHNGIALRYIDAQTEEMCIIAVKKTPSSFGHVNHKTYKVCKAVFELEPSYIILFSSEIRKRLLKEKNT